MRVLSRAIRGFTFFLLSLFTVGFSQAALASNETLERINSSGQIIIGMSGEQPPFNFVASNDEVVGFDVDIAKKISDSLSIKMEIKLMPFNELQQALEKGEIDIIMSGFSMTQERADDFDFIGPYALTGKSLLTTTDRLHKIQTTTGFNHKDIKLVALNNSTSLTLAKQRLEKTTVTPVDHYEDALLQILSGEADALIADLTICELLVIRDVNRSLSTLNKPLAIEEIGIAINKDEKELKQKIRAELDQLGEKGELKNLHAKWFDDPGWLVLMP